jgi:hypothetical protein
MCITTQKNSNQSKLLEHIYFIISFKNAKECVSYPQALINNNFKNDVLIAILVSEVAMPYNWVVLSFVMHGIDDCKHIGTFFVLIDLQLMCNVNCNWFYKYSS